MAKDTIDLLRDLIAIDSVNPSLAAGGAGEQQIAERIADELRAIGADVHVQPVAPARPNVIGVLEGRQDGPSLILCGHLDTVGVAGMRAPFDPVIRDGRVYGRGAQDMKGGLAAIVGALRALAESGGVNRGRVIVAGVADEEDASLGAESFVAGWKGDMAVVAEPTDLQIGIAHKGFAWMQVTTTGVAAHGSRPREGRDAILSMGRLLARLDERERGRQQETGHHLLGPPSLHASFIAGGREWSTYPDQCDLRLERRTLPGEPDDEPLMEVTRILESLVQEDGEFAASAALIFERGAYELPEDHALVERVRTAARAVGSTDEVTGVSFWADSGVLGAAGIPSVLFGPGGAGLHSVEEYVRIADVVTCQQVLVNLARSICV
jgi:acetylornithine deacetylase